MKMHDDQNHQIYESKLFWKVELQYLTEDEILEHETIYVQ